MPYRTHLFGLRDSVRIEDLEAGHVLRLPCRKCGHVVSVAPHSLRARFPAQAKLQNIMDRYRCRRCRSVLPPLWYVEVAFPPVMDAAELDGIGLPRWRGPERR